MRPHSLLLPCPKSYNRICFSPTLHSYMGSLSKSHSSLIILRKQGWPWSVTLDVRRRVGKALILGRASCQFLPPLLSCHSLPILSPGRKKVERKQAHRSATSFANCGCELPVSNLIEFVAIFLASLFPPVKSSKFSSPALPSRLAYSCMFFPVMSLSYIPFYSLRYRILSRRSSRYSASIIRSVLCKSMNLSSVATNRRLALELELQSL
jgi:hypothetical protein